MPFARRRPTLVLTPEIRAELESLSQSRTEAARRVDRARVLVAYANGERVSAIARRLAMPRPKVDRCIDRALQFGPVSALTDLPRSGRPSIITSEARAWLISVACQKPKDLGYSYELWTTRLLAQHVRDHCRASGHPSLERLGRGTVSKILTKDGVRPHKITYYLARRDPEFDAKMVQVLLLYRDVELMREKGDENENSLVATLSLDEKPGIQAIANTAPDLPPVPGKHRCVARDHEYVRHGTVTLMAAIDLLSGEVHGQVVERHRSREFIALLKRLDQRYAEKTKIRIVLDNHSAHISKETRAFLATVPQRFEFIFTPKHGSWLNLIETFFSKLARTMLRGIRVNSKEELKQRLEQYLAEVNADPVVHRWTWQPSDLHAV